MVEGNRKKFTPGMRASSKMLPIVVAGRDYEKQVQDIYKEGMWFTPGILRRSVIGGMGVRRRQSENCIVFGCACFGTLQAVMSGCRLLDLMDVGYSFLEKEYCCGLGLVQSELEAGRNRSKADEQSREFISMNIAMARETGAKRMIYFCPWCTYMARRFYQDADIPQLYFFDFVFDMLKDQQLRIEPQRAGYFGGRPHRWPVLVPERDFDLDWAGYRRFLGGIEGLELVDIPHYCCSLAAQAVFDRAGQQGLGRIVTPCIVCYGGLSRKAPGEIQISFATDLLLEAIGKR